VVWDVSNPAYAADDEVDAKGNGNGLVCAQAKKLVDDGSGGTFQQYNFIDDAGTTH
jgi:hypothetical protein